MASEKITALIEEVKGLTVLELSELVHALEEGRPVELVSIAASDGSTPRGAGAMMAVFPGGGITGTIGGGNVEFECQRLAAELLELHKEGVYPRELR